MSSDDKPLSDGLSAEVVRALSDFVAGGAGGDVNAYLDSRGVEHPRFHTEGRFAPHMLDCGPNGRPATRQVPDGHGGQQTFYYCVPA